MRMRSIWVITAILVVAVMPKATSSASLREVGAIPLPGVEGRIDHLGVDVQGHRLFVSALGNNTLEVLDLGTLKRLHSITGLKEPQGVYYLPAGSKLFVASDGDGTCKIFDGNSYNLLGQVDYSSDADNVRHDEGNHVIYVGYGEGALGAIDARTGGKLFDIPLAGHPESFRLEKSGSRIFVNVPTAGHTIAVVDRMKRAVVATWHLDGQANFPMTFDETDHRLLVVTRQPPRLVVVDTQSGRTVASYSTVGDADDAFYDAAHKRVYITGGAGSLDVFAQGDADHYRRVEQIPTASGARTGLFVPELNRLYVAVPHRRNQGAEIRVFETLP